MRLVATFIAALVACTAGSALTARPAQASPNLLSFIMDDDLALYDSYGTRDFAISYMNRIGADGIRVTVSWKFVSGEENGKPVRQPRRQRGKRAEDPRSYRRDIWDRFDDVVRLARHHNLAVLFNVTAPGPVWAHPRAPRSRRFDQPAWRPNVAAYYRFVKAVGRRYSGSYNDENQDRGALPKVVIWSIMNEGNQPANLSPQMEYNRRLRKQIPVAPILYRQLYYAATKALQETGHGDDTILMGETAPLGGIRNTPRVHLWPKQFVRELFCLRPNLQPYRGLEARVRQCSLLARNGPFLVKGWAHHPYTQKKPPTWRDRHRDSVNIANIDELPALLDQIAEKTKLIPSGLPIWLTEAGWETRPPDPTRGVPIARQAPYINTMQRMAYDSPRVSVDTQFILRDVKPRAKYRGKRRYLQQYWATWQSGLLYANGKPKPALLAYVLPFDLRRSGPNTLKAWGQLKFLPNGTESDVYLQFRPAGSQNWTPASGAIRVTNPMGFWEADVASPGPGVWRSVIPYADSYVTSREVSVSG
jgi:hypothetical protein